MLGRANLNPYRTYLKPERAEYKPESSTYHLGKGLATPLIEDISALRKATNLQAQSGACCSNHLEIAKE